MKKTKAVETDRRIEEVSDGELRDRQSKTPLPA